MSFVWTSGYVTPNRRPPSGSFAGDPIDANDFNTLQNSVSELERLSLLSIAGPFNTAIARAVLEVDVVSGGIGVINAALPSSGFATSSEQALFSGTPFTSGNSCIAQARLIAPIPSSGSLIYPNGDLNVQVFVTIPGNGSTATLTLTNIVPDIQNHLLVPTALPPGKYMLTVLIIGPA